MAEQLTLEATYSMHESLKRPIFVTLLKSLGSREQIFINHHQNHGNQKFYQQSPIRQLILVISTAIIQNTIQPSWGYKDINDDGEKLIAWASGIDLQLLYDPKQKGTPQSARWNRDYNPDLCWVYITK